MKVRLSVRLIEWKMSEEIFEIPGVEEMTLMGFIDTVVKSYGKEDIVVCRMGEESNVAIICNKRIKQLTDIVHDGDSVFIMLPWLGG